MIWITTAHEILEIFVDPARFGGTGYGASNWIGWGARSAATAPA
jgi:hypothetical protein